MAMKSEAEIQQRIALLKLRADEPGTKKSALPMIVAAEDALQWVLGENEDELWSMQARIDQKAN